MQYFLCRLPVMDTDSMQGQATLVLGVVQQTWQHWGFCTPRAAHHHFTWVISAWLQLAQMGGKLWLDLNSGMLPKSGFKCTFCLHSRGRLERLSSPVPGSSAASVVWWPWGLVVWAGWVPGTDQQWPSVCMSLWRGNRAKTTYLNNPHPREMVLQRQTLYCIL